LAQEQSIVKCSMQFIPERYQWTKSTGRQKMTMNFWIIIKFFKLHLINLASKGTLKYLFFKQGWKIIKSKISRQLVIRTMAKKIFWCQLRRERKQLSCWRKEGKHKSWFRFCIKDSCAQIIQCCWTSYSQYKSWIQIKKNRNWYIRAERSSETTCESKCG